MAGRRAERWLMAPTPAPVRARSEFLSGTGVGGVVDLFHTGGGDVGVDLGGGEVGVAEELLDAAEVGSVVEEVGGEAVAQFVGTDLELDAGTAQVFLEQVVDGAGGDAAAEFAEKEGALMDSGGVAVVLDGAEGGRADGAEAVLAAFAGDAEGLVDDVDVSDVEFHQFVQAEAGAVEELENGGVAGGGPGGGALRAFGREGEGKREELLDLAEGENHRQGAAGFGQLDLQEGADGETVAADEEFIKAAEGGEVEPDGGVVELPFHQGKQPCPEVVGGGVGPGGEGAVAGAEFAEGVGVVDEGERRGVALDFHELEEGGFLGCGGVRGGGCWCSRISGAC